MAIINNKLIHFKSKSNFNSRYAESTDNGVTFGDFLGTSIVFIQDAKEIWTHGQFFKCVSDEEFEKLSTIGDVSLLETTIKDNLVNAVNELKNSVDSKQNIISFNTEYNAESNKAATIQDITNATEKLVEPYEINLTNLLSAEDSESISTAIGGIDNLNATVQDNRIIVGTISNGNVSVSIRILGNVTTLYYLLDSVLGLTLNEIAITNTSGTLSKSVTTHSVLTENMVINSLNSDETTLPLSAAQGKALDSKISGSAPYIIDGNILWKDSPTSEEINTAIGGWDNLVAAIQNQRTVILLLQGVLVYASFLGYHDESKEIAIDFISIETDNSDAVTTRNMCLFLNNVNGTISLRYVEDLTLSENYEYTYILDTTDKTVLGAINELKSDIAAKQNATDETLNTTDKTIVGAINELASKRSGVGKVDPTSTGTGEIFNSYTGSNANVASGFCAHAEGWDTQASGDSSHAEGEHTQATGTASHAEGHSSKALGNYSHAEGYNTQTTGMYSHAEGGDTQATKNFAHAEGRETQATGLYSHAEGYKTQALLGSSHAEGSNTQASEGASHAEGFFTIAKNPYEHAEGSHNVSNTGDTEDLQTRHSVGIGNFVDSNRKNAHEIMVNGDHYIYGLGGYDGTNAIEETSQTLQEVINSKQATITAGTGLEFEGTTLNVTLDTTVFKVVSVLPDSPAQGDENKIHLVPAESTGANNAYTEYVWVNSAWEILGEYTSEVDLTPYLTSETAETTYQKITDDSLQTTSKTVAGAINEVKTLADSKSSVGKIDSTSDGTGEIFNSYEGFYTNVASGTYSHAEGKSTEATGGYSHAEGNNTTASGYSSHAEGVVTTASGDYSHAEGVVTTASGTYSHAEGYNTSAAGNYSHAEGYYTQTFSSGEHAEGSWNKSYDSKDTSIRVIHSVGIGSSSSGRKNAHEIKFNGDHYVYGIGGYDGTNYSTAQTLQEVVNELLAKVQELESKNTELESRLAALEGTN